MKKETYDRLELNTNSYYAYHKKLSYYNSPYHRHSNFELEIVTCGSAKHILNNQTTTVRTGDAWILSPISAHKLSTDKDFEVANITFHESVIPPAIAECLEMNSGICCNFDENQTKKCASEIKYIIANQENKPLYSDEDNKSVIAHLVISFLRKAGCTSQVTSSIIQNAIQYIKNNYYKEISVRIVAKNLNITENYLGMIFRKRVGQKFTDFVTSIRLKNATELLSSTSFTVKEIAFKSGFNSNEYFCFVFKKTFGITPSEYRQIVE